MALIMGLQQAKASGDASAATSSGSERSLLDRPANEPLLRLEGEPVRLDLTTSAWLARLRGQASLGPTTTSRQELNGVWGMDSMEGAFQGDLSLLWRNWTLRFTGSEFGTDATQSATGAVSFGSTAFTAGQLMRSSFDFYSWGVDVQSWLWRPLSKQQFPWQAPVAEDLGGDLQIVGLMGGRGFGIRQQEQNLTTGSSTTYSQTFGTVMVGAGFDAMVDLKGRVGFLDHLEFTVTGAWGPMWPGSEGSYYEVRAQLVAWITGNAGVLFGYRYTGMDFTQGDYSFGGDVAGLIVGGELRF
jgi:hypothetical protein